MDSNTCYIGTGRRKTSTARIRLCKGNGIFLINKIPIEKYLPLKTLIVIAKQSLEATDNLNEFDVFINVKGGGYTGQAGAIRLGIARALLKVNPENRKILKNLGYLTRDDRKKERKKYGLKAARKAPQFSKR